MSNYPRYLWGILASVLIVVVACGESEQTTDNGAGYEPSTEECNFTAVGSMELIATLEELTSRSSLVVVGTIVEVQAPVWGPEVTSRDGSFRYIETHYIVRVEDRLQGDAGDTLIVREPGGSIDGCTQTYSPQTHMGINQRALLFLSDPADRPQGTTYSVVGGDQGYWSVNEDQTVQTRESHFDEYNDIALEQIASQIAPP